MPVVTRKYWKRARKTS